MISKGVQTSLPRINEFGENPVVSWMVHLYAIMTCGKCSSQSVWFSFTKFLGIVVSVRLNVPPYHPIGGGMVFYVSF